MFIGGKRMKVISIRKFMLMYYHVRLKLKDKYKYSHDDIKGKHKIKSWSFEYGVENVKKVASGKIILVEDDYGKVRAYDAPEDILTSISDCEYIESESNKVTKDEKKEACNLLDYLDQMRTYELQQLLSKYKNKKNAYRAIRRILESRGVYENKIYKCQREYDETMSKEIPEDCPEFNDSYARRQRVRCKKI